jgi:hypothetical protein
MNKFKLRRFLLIGLLLPSWAGAQDVRVLVQSSPLAGFTYHAAPELWRQMRVGDRLDLRREPDNLHDARAIRVEWRGHKLGYVPRRENATLAWAMDEGQGLGARISRMDPHAEPRRRIEFEVFVE